MRICCLLGSNLIKYSYSLFNIGSKYFSFCHSAFIMSELGSALGDVPIRSDELQDKIVTALSEKRQYTRDYFKEKYARKEAEAKQRHVEAWQALSPEEKTKHKEQRIEVQRLSNERLRAAFESGVNVCVDMGFEDKHRAEKEKKSLWKQLSLTYAALKLAITPIHLHVTSIVPGSDTERGLKLQVCEKVFKSKSFITDSRELSIG